MKETRVAEGRGACGAVESALTESALTEGALTEDALAESALAGLAAPMTGAVPAGVGMAGAAAAGDGAGAETDGPKLKRRRKDRADREKVTLRTFIVPLLFLAPFLVGIIIFTAYPFVSVILTSFKEGYKFTTHTYTGIGLQNYRDVISDPYFLEGLRNTFLYVLFVVPIATILSLLIATLLNSQVKLKGLFQTCYFLPMVTSITAIGLVWKWLYNYDYGFINYLLSLFGIDPINWLNDPAYNLPALIIYGIWSMIPFTTILLLAGLQNVDPQYMTAAKVDGASTGRIFFRITLPLLAPTVGLTVIVNMISASKVFTELFPLFNGKPGAAYSLYTVVYYLYDQFFVKWRLDRASASAVILFLIVLVLTLVQLFVQRKWEDK